MEVKYRFWATVFIWTITTIVGLLLDVDPDMAMGVLVVLASTVLISTGFIWNWGRLPLEMDRVIKSPREQEKPKRATGDNVALLRELLTDDELEAVKARLVDDMTDNYDDGELSLSALLEEDQK